MLKWFTKKKEKECEPLNFSVLKTDIHSHFIPGIDDGSPDMETTIALIEKMQALGFEKIITMIFSHNHLKEAIQYHTR